MSSDARPRGPAPSNVELALDAVRDAIVAGRLRPGERIKEIPPAEELGFSRALGTLALHKLMLDAESLETRPLERELTRLVRAGELRRARRRGPNPPRGDHGA